MKLTKIKEILHDWCLMQISDEYPVFYFTMRPAVAPQQKVIKQDYCRPFYDMTASGVIFMSLMWGEFIVNLLLLVGANNKENIKAMPWLTKKHQLCWQKAFLCHKFIMLWLSYVFRLSNITLKKNQNRISRKTNICSSRIANSSSRSVFSNVIGLIIE